MTAKKVKTATIRKTASIILDTNFFVDMFRFKIGFDDIEDVVERKCDFWVVEPSIDELRRMKAKESKIALKMIGGKVNVLKLKKKISNVDDALISLIKQNKKGGGPVGYIVATNDAKLRKRIKTLGTRVIYLRARKYLEIH